MSKKTTRQDAFLENSVYLALIIALAPAFVLGITLGLVLFSANPPLTISELLLFEIEALVIWIFTIIVGTLLYSLSRNR